MSPEVVTGSAIDPAGLATTIRNQNDPEQDRASLIGAARGLSVTIDREKLLTDLRAGDITLDGFLAALRAEVDEAAASASESTIEPASVRRAAAGLRKLERL
jgi:hypothetical protein